MNPLVFSILITMVKAVLSLLESCQVEASKQAGKPKP